MIGFEEALALLLLTTGLSIVSRWLPWPRPITYVLGGVAFGHLPGFPKIGLDPGFFFLCFLPPLLFSDGWLMPLREFARFKRSILLLAIGLVIFTTVTVGLAAHALVPGLPLSMALALGAVISPTDAVAVNAIIEQLKVPARLKTILNGESLMNDATGLVAFKFALAASIAGTFSLRSAALSFLFLAAGGLGIGLLVGYAVGRLRDFLIRIHGADALIETTVSLLTPYLAFFAADWLNVSSILSVVAAGLYSGWRDPVRTDAETRQTSWTVWLTVLFWLNGLAFVLLGLQFPHLFEAVRHDFSMIRLVGLVAAIVGVAMAARLAWFFPGAYLPFLLSHKIRRTETRPSWRAVLVGGWAGIRGTVTLASALSITMLRPDGTAYPGRDIVIFLAFGVIAATLLLQGTTTEWLIHRLGLREDESLLAEDRLARISAVDAGLKGLRGLATSENTPEEAAALGQVIAEYDLRLSALVADGETGSQARHRRHAQNRYTLIALRAERRAVDELWRGNVIADEIHRPLQQLLDHEEAMLRASSDR